MDANNSKKFFVLVFTTLLGGIAIFSWLECYQSSSSKKSKRAVKNDRDDLCFEKPQHFPTNQCVSLDSDEIHDMGLILGNFSNQNRDNYELLISHYPISSCMTHVTESLEELQKNQLKTQTLLEEQATKINMDRERIAELEKTIVVESKFRQEAENCVELYRSYINKVNNDVQTLNLLLSSIKSNASLAENWIEDLLPLVHDDHKSKLTDVLNLIARISDQIT